MEDHAGPTSRNISQISARVLPAASRKSLPYATKGMYLLVMMKLLAFLSKTSQLAAKSSCPLTWGEESKYMKISQ